MLIRINVRQNTCPYIYVQQVIALKVTKGPVWVSSDIIKTSDQDQLIVIIVMKNVFNIEYGSLKYSFKQNVL